MTRKRGRLARRYHLRVRTVRRDPIDYDALARAALEQAAMDQPRDQERDTEHLRAQRPPRSERRAKRSKEYRHDRLA